MLFVDAEAQCIVVGSDLVSESEYSGKSFRIDKLEWYFYANFANSQVEL